MITKIVELTRELLDYNCLFLEYFQEVRSSGVKHEFHQKIKPFVDSVDAVVQDWEIVMKRWLLENQSKYIHVRQVDTTVDHIEKLAIQCFFPETSKSKFLNSQKTVEFFLKEVLNECHHMKKDAT
ncbi:DUF1798 family protein [Bacillus rubiinfantis]|uniref:DUF1798 family protein n=1 Tax=Bacillus rubiinfantis TaxID=1499680 RepID=UPI0005A9B6A4|nr:DUF1798 family protein [Bacillus rubiinfantis]